MNRSPFHPRTWMAVLAITVLLAAVTTGAMFTVSWTEKGPPLDLLAVLLPTAGTVAALVMWVRRPATPFATSTVTDVEAAAQALAGIVERQWQEEERHRLVDDPHPMPVRWRLARNQGVMSPCHLIAPEGFVFDGHSNDIANLANQFRVLERRRLVITGGPGTGKTTLAVQLLLHLLATRAADQETAQDGKVVPVPVLLPVSGWDPNVHPSLQDWLAARLSFDYPALQAAQLGPGATDALVRGGHILPILDGLDEIGENQRMHVLTTLNRDLGEHGALILTSRTAEFRTTVGQAGRPLTAAAVIVPRPLARQDAIRYLRDCLSSSPPSAWEQVLDALDQGRARGLVDLVTTPLGLWLIRTVYLAPCADPSPLAGPLGHDTAALRAHLLDQVIPSVIAACSPSTDPADPFRPRRRWDPEDVRRYLTHLACMFPPAQTRDIAWWHIASTVPHIQPIAGITFGIAVGLTLGLTAGLVDGLAGGLAGGLWAGFAAALVFGLGGGLLVGRFRTNETPGYANLRIRGRTCLLFRLIKKSLVSGLLGGLVLGLVFALGTWLAGEPYATFGAGLGGWLGTGTGIALAHGAIAWAEQPTLTSTSTPRSSWDADKTLICLRMIVFGSMGVLVGALGVGLGLKFGAGLRAGLVSGLGVGLWAGLMWGRHHSWLVCITAVARLTLQRRLPWQVMNFLDDAHRLGLLRAVGPIYQFRHGALHDHLAAGGCRETRAYR